MEDEEEGLGDDLFWELQLHVELEEQEEFISQLHYECLRNIRQLPLELVAKTYNTISARIHQLFREPFHQADSVLQQKISTTKANTYCLLHATKALLASRQIGDQLAFLSELESSLRELFEFRLPTIEKMWLLLYSIIQGDLSD